MTTQAKISTQPILVVEDNPQDWEATKRAFHKSGLRNPIIHCEDGDEALDYLFRKGEYSDPKDSPRPGVILLDLNMPGTDGYQVLKEVKQDPSLNKIPVVVLTTSSDERDIGKCYGSGANSYIQKPVDLQGFMLAIEKLKEYWFEISILPKVNGDSK